MNARRFGIVGLAAALLAVALVAPRLAAPSTVAAQSPSRPVCLIGTWDTLDMEAYVRSAIGAGTTPLRVENVTGQMRFIFRDSGSMEQIIENVTVTATIRMDTMAVTMNANYGFDFREDSSGLVSTQPPLYGSGTADMMLNGEPFAAGIDIGAMIALSPEYGAGFRYDCAGDRLELFPQFPDRVTAPIILQRVRP